MIKQSDRKIVKEQFGVEFYYSEQPKAINYKYKIGIPSKKKVGKIRVYKINSKDLLQTITFFGEDNLKTKQEFADACTVWCDQNAA